MKYYLKRDTLYIMERGRGHGDIPKVFKDRWYCRLCGKTETSMWLCADIIETGKGREGKSYA